MDTRTPSDQNAANEAATTDRQSASYAERVNGRWGVTASEDVELDTWDQCLRLILNDGGPMTYYRGQRNHQWPLSSSLERFIESSLERSEPAKYEAGYGPNDLSKIGLWAALAERKLLQSFQDHVLSFGIPNMPPHVDRLGWWEVMQHHGAPTRLLDWTLSPFIGLWFAFEHHLDGQGDVALWVFNARSCEIANKELLVNVNDKPDTDFIDSREWQNRLVNEAMRAGSALLLPVKPRHSLDRAAAQQSHLTFNPQVPFVGKVEDNPNRSLAKRVRIREEWKPDILRACTNLGYNRMSLYRDLDSIAFITTSEIVRYESGTPSSVGT